MAIQSPHLEFLGEGALFAPHFDDVYYKEDGIAESMHVFIQGVALKEFIQSRYDAHIDSGGSGSDFQFIIGETGFGTGLNFILALKSWRELKLPGCLRFYSVEKYPLSSKQMTLIQSQRSTLQGLIQDWLENYCALVDDSSTSIEIPGQDFHLLISLGEGDSGIHSWLSQSLPRVDAWFLDGFDPSKNPEMWTSELFDGIAKMSQPDSRIATFTSAGMVKRPLKRIGFQTSKRAGILGKQHVLQGAMDRSLAWSDQDWAEYLRDALYQAMQKGAAQEAQQLLNEGACLDQLESLYVALSQGICHQLERLDLGRDVSLESRWMFRDHKRSETLLHASIRSGQLAEVRFCLEVVLAGVDANQLLDGSGRHGLFLAAYLKHVDILRYLIDEAGLDIDLQDRFNKSLKDYQSIENLRIFGLA